MIRLIVRTRPAHGDARRYRAGLGPFGREPLEVEVTPEQAEALRADQVLLVADAEAVDARPDEAVDEAKSAPPAGTPRPRRKGVAQAANG